MTYSHLLFDLDRTLFDFDASAVTALENTVRSLGFSYKPELQRLYANVNHQVWAEFEAGTLPQADIKAERFRRFGIAANLDFDPEAAGENYLAYLAQGTALVDGALALMQTLHGNVTLGAVTNGLKEVQRARIENSALAGMFEAIVVSDEVGIAKPDPAIFDIAFAQLNWPPKDAILYIGDSLGSDIQGGLNAGIDTCWYNPTNKVHSGAPQPTHTVSTLAEIATLI